VSPRRKKPDPTLLDIIDDAPADTGAGHDANGWPPAGSGWPPSGAWPPADDRRLSGSGRESIVSLHEVAQEKYLNYALSVITSRALPDVRDGLKPVQRRILFTMWQQNLTADAKCRKCAKVVGDVMGSFHPHGDTAIYDTLARMAQSFSLRYPLIDGSGNFGSLDGDAPAAMRYTECRLARLSDQMLEEIDHDTVPFRPNYDGTKAEPVVLPARLPNLLVNGATGIAVGMATSVPPHNLGEVCTALLKLLDNPDLTSVQLCRYVKGPDFPTGGHVLNSAEELKTIYRTGSGSIRLRGTWEPGSVSRGGKTVFVTSIPYMVNKAQLVERIAEVVISRKLPPLVDIKDVSTDDVRIQLELKKDADEKMVMAYLCKHTPLQTSFPVNLTCLIPTENAEIGRPERLDLKSILWHFLHFRLDVVTRRLEHELASLNKRIHVLEGFEKIFDLLDEIIRIIRKSDGKADAAGKIMARFELDAEQTDAILELKLYRLARLEILAIRSELEEKRKRARQIGLLLKDENSRWKLVRADLELLLKQYGSASADPRRTLIESVEEVEYSADDFIVEEDNVVVVSRDGWVKRQKEVKDLTSTRLREGDAVLAVLPGSTRASAVFLTNFGVAYTSRIVDIPASTGYGEPIQRLFKFRDGEKVVAAFSLDARIAPDITPRKEGDVPRCHAVAVTSDGYSLRFGLDGFVEPSTRGGRRFARPSEGVEVVGVAKIDGTETIIAATAQARAMLCKVGEINYLSGPGKGVILIKLNPAEDRVLGFVASTGDRDLLTVETSRGAEQTISTGKYEVTGRGGKGRELLQRGQFTRIVPVDLAAPAALDDATGD
jgi:DNA gyrase subunit A